MLIIPLDGIFDQPRFIAGCVVSKMRIGDLFAIEYLYDISQKLPVNEIDSPLRAVVVILADWRERLTIPE